MNKWIKLRMCDSHCFDFALKCCPKWIFCLLVVVVAVATLIMQMLLNQLAIETIIQKWENSVRRLYCSKFTKSGRMSLPTKLNSAMNEFLLLFQTERKKETEKEKN